ncbi:hypothetical protein MSP7336_01839 [Mycobacterium shimoidei]|uniref:Uncharacterized protein n=1 Tax=Mycobacterium shimoidei TaxID=29313 RepID=A0A375YY25_MYCSH|nr:hypothetical protein [Mycobacterium shimoidei]SRX93600.1 hypothetical protein MSP7336_01839 [Mycobacterium shimoidei]
MSLYHLATCLNCQPLLQQPFDDPAARDRWLDQHHESTGHRVIAASVWKSC